MNVLKKSLKYFKRNPDVISTKESTKEEIIDKLPERYEAIALAIVNATLTIKVQKANLLAVFANSSSVFDFLRDFLFVRLKIKLF